MAAAASAARVTCARRQPRVARRGSRAVARAGKGGDGAIGAWLDLTSLVSGGGSAGEAVGVTELANAIGSEVYADVNGWHLFLRDMSSYHIGLARALAAKIELEGRADERDVVDILKKVPVKLGGGKVELPLFDVVPSGCVMDLVDICERYADDRL